MLVTGLLGLACLISVPWAFWLWREHKTLMLPLVLVSSPLCSWMVDPPLDIITGIYMPVEAPFRLWTAIGRPVPLGDLFCYVAGAAMCYIMYRYMVIRRLSIQKIWLIAAAFALTEQAIADFLLVRGHGWLYYSNPVTFLGEPIYVPFQYAGFAVLYVVIYAFLEDLRGPKALWSLVAIPIGVNASTFALGAPIVMAIHSAYPDVVNWTLAIISAFLYVAVPHYGLKLPQLARLREPAQAVSHAPISA